MPNKLKNVFMDLSSRINGAVEVISQHMDVSGAIGVVLGTGLGGFVDELEVSEELSYTQIPHFPKSTVEGHEGKLILGMMEGRKVLAMKGRFHFYEGYSMDQVVFPIRVMKALGIEKILLSNASGGVNPSFKVGDIMLIKDHINLFPSNPLIGANDDRLGPRFPDMSEPYSHALRARLHQAAESVGLNVHEGVYAGVSGPCFETPAEYKYLRVLSLIHI